MCKTRRPAFFRTTKRSSTQKKHAKGNKKEHLAGGRGEASDFSPQFSPFFSHPMRAPSLACSISPPGKGKKTVVTQAYSVRNTGKRHRCPILVPGDFRFKVSFAIQAAVVRRLYNTILREKLAIKFYDVSISLRSFSSLKKKLIKLCI